MLRNELSIVDELNLRLRQLRIFLQIGQGDFCRQLLPSLQQTLQGVDRGEGSRLVPGRLGRLAGKTRGQAL